MQSIEWSLAGKTDFFLGRAFLSSPLLIEKIYSISPRIALITDETVAELYGKTLSQHLGAHLFTIPPGERSKTREWKARLEDQMIEKGLGRDTVLVALGGGVVTDLAGFIAATYCRGIPFVSIPTSLIGMVDASIGGKVGVNTAKGKNLIGAFYFPRFLFIDLSLLDSLPVEEMQNGLSEIIKYGLIENPSLLSETVTMESRVREGIKIKCKVIKHDPYERGMRRVLNFGHTVGHALETVSKHKLSHGEAIAIGMVVEGILSGIDTAPFFRALDIPLRWPKSIEVSEVLDAIERDKKARAGKARFVLLDEIGKPSSFEGAYCTELPLQRVEEVLYSYLDY